MALSELEKKRQENIRRNQELLKKLDLDSISDSIKKEVDNKSFSSPSSQKRRKTTKKPVIKKEVLEPSRRSRRIAGIKSELEDPKQAARIREEEELKQHRDMIFEKNVMDRKLSHIGLDSKVEEKKNEEDKEDEEEAINIDENNRVLKLVQSLGDKFSAGDFYEEIRNSQTNEFDNLNIYPRFDPLDIKICHNRITSMFFHPSTTNRIVVGGDTTGNVGIWLVDEQNNDTKEEEEDDDDDEPSISILQLHGRNVSKIMTPTFSPEKIYTSSYDGSIRVLDLNKLTSTELLYLNEPGTREDIALGVSDINQCQDSSVIFMTTLDGEFYQHDTRTPFNTRQRHHLATKDLLRLHDKKIGGFAVNPNTNYQIATASLDRTLRIWDLRNVNKSVYSEFENQKSPHMYGNYNSRLSVSCVDWNQENRLVCNGYDDNICLFDYSGGSKLDNELPVITEWKSDFVPPTKSSEESELLPNNLTPFTKIKHNCQTGRWVSILKSHWQTNPADGVQKFIIANMNRGLDIYNQDGQILAHLNEQVGAVPAACTLHPSQNWAVGGSASGKVYLFE
ncbi:WD domain, G-beta repeat family protein [Candida albicans]|uniref:DNA damage-binding protein CMR1 n=1 Tax=Candida albicans TaxID=5476 RepID=A0A8H6C1P9_CANAX|nr:WD domain, G-beta repeat family protein [Candida albicans]